MAIAFAAGVFVNRYRIRRIEAGDSLDELTAMIHRAFGPLGRMGLACTGVDQSLGVTSRRMSRGECLVALDRERIVGTVTLEAPDRGAACDWYRRPEVASLHQFAVDPQHQGRGCGKALLHEATRWAQRHGFCELALDTPADASHLLRFYQAQGFRVVGEMQKSGCRYRSSVLSKTVASVRPH
jgi:GNAT superfamily N-acetyltransferase